MPYQTPCPSCRKVGFVRYENVIKGKVASRLFYCGGCEHQWSVTDAAIEAQAFPPPPKGRTRFFRPKRTNNT